MPQEACCTCATLLAAVPRVSSSSEKPLPGNRRLDCCGRTICGDCIRANPRFLSYCPYCQTSGRYRPQSAGTRLGHRQPEDEINSIPPGALVDPPPYSALPPSGDAFSSPPPPPYTISPPLSPPAAPRPSEKPSLEHKQPSPEREPDPAPEPQYVIHYLRHHPHPTPDTIPSLSLRYGIPASALRAHNRIPPDADYLLQARQTLLIPPTAGTSTGTSTDSAGKDPLPVSVPLTSLSPHPVEDLAERERKTAIRRWMVACKEADYDAAVVYLEESGYNLCEAVKRYWEDCEWERSHPLDASGRVLLKGKGKGMRRAEKGEKGRLAWLMGG